MSRNITGEIRGLDDEPIGRFYVAVNDRDELMFGVSDYFDSPNERLVWDPDTQQWALFERRDLG